MGVSRSTDNSPMPSAPNASFTPSKTPILSVMCVRDGAGDWTKACVHDDAVAAMRIDDRMIFYLLC